MNFSKMDLTTQSLNQYAWRQVLDDAEIKECSHYSEKFRRQSQAYQANGDLLGTIVYNFLGNVTSPLMEPPIFMTDELPSQERKKAEKERAKFISSNLSDGELFVLRDLVDTIADAEMRSRVADILWLCKCAPEGSYPIKMAEIAISSYLETSQYFQETENYAAYTRRVRRAAQLAPSVDGKKTHKIRQLVIDHLDKVIESSLSNQNDSLIIATMNILQGCCEDSLRSIKHNDFSAYARKLASIAASQGKLVDQFNENYHSAFCTKKAYWELELGWYAILQDKEAKREASLHLVEVEAWYAQQAIKHNEPQAYAVAAGRIKTALHTLKKIEDTFGKQEDTSQRIEELHRQMLSYQRLSMSQHQVQIMIELDDPVLQSLAQQLVTGRVIHDSMQSLALNIDPNVDLIFHESELEKQAKDDLETFKSLSLVSTSYVDSEGKTKALSNLTTHNEPLKSQIFKGLKFYQFYYSHNYIIPAVRYIKAEHTVTIESVFAMVEMSPFIPKERQLTYAHGLLLGFQQSFVTATHLLIPQLENSLRYILKNEGIITSKTEDIQDSYLLHEVLRIPQLSTILSSDLVFNLKGLLIERMGYNLRNDLFHGLLDDNQLASPVFAYCWWLILHICSLTAYQRYL